MLGLQALLDNLFSDWGKDRVLSWWNALPKRIELMSACSGSGLFELSAHALVSLINRDKVKSIPIEARPQAAGLSGLWTLDFFCSSFVLDSDVLGS